MVEAIFIEPNITEEENERNWAKVKEVLAKIADDMRKNGRTIEKKT